LPRRAAVDEVINEKVSHKRRELFDFWGHWISKPISHLKVNNPTSVVGEFITGAEGLVQGQF